jgi:hypothetical protein
MFRCILHHFQGIAAIFILKVSRRLFNKYLDKNAGGAKVM